MKAEEQMKGSASGNLAGGNLAGGGTSGGKTQAEVLVKALPYIRYFQNKTVVVKYGGNAMINEDLKTAVIQDIILMSCVGIRTVLVHGGGPEIDAMLKKVGKESRFVKGLRYTDEETMEIVQMILCGKINKDITSLFQQNGGKAIGLSGLDGAMLKACFLKGEDDLGLVGEIQEVDTTILDLALNNGMIPVVSTVAYGVGDAAGKTLNINADIAAAKIAAALGAEKLVLMTDVQGILRNVDDPGSLIQTVSLAELAGLKKEGILNKGMIPKTDCCVLALEGGVKKAHILDGRIPHSIIIELFTDDGVGTMLSAN
ncbi:MAG: acetylglutamate kinase [Spirochaetes bacterium]|nr:acetylglutamate kinase [Spirochaetota bacterium]